MKGKNSILDTLRNSPSVALLRARNCGIITEFLAEVFGDMPAVSHENIHSLLAEYLNSHEFEDEEESDILYTDTYEEKASKYIRNWTDSGFLTNYRNEDGEIYFELSSHSSKVLDWLAGLKQEEYIGTESKFKSIISQLRELVEYTNEDREKRLQLLVDKKMEIEHQIQQQDEAVDQQGRQRLPHGIIGLVGEIQHAEAGHSKGVHGENAGSHRRGRGVKAAPFKQYPDHRQRKGAKQRGKRKDHKKRAVQRRAHVALVSIVVGAGERPVVLWEEHNADAVDQRGGHGGKQLICVIDAADRTVAVGLNSVRIGQIAPQEDGGGKQRHQRGPAKELQIRVAQPQAGAKHKASLPGNGKDHRQLQKPGEAHCRHIFRHLLRTGKEQQKQDQRKIVGQAQAALETVISHGLKYCHQQIDQDDQRKRGQADT